MDVLAAGERLKQAGILRKRGEDAELDLRVVGGEELVVALARDEGAADFAALRGADGDVLEVGVLRVEASGAGGELIKSGVDAAIGGNGIRQRIDVSREELARFAVLEHLGNDGMERRERGERLLVGGILAGLGFLRVLAEGEFAEEDLAELLGRADIEGGSGVLVDGGFQPREVGAKFFAHVFERDGIEADAFVFHGGEDGQQG